MRLESIILRLRLQHLRLLVALAESESVQEAAHRVSLTQSAASKLLADLERAFESRLFERGRLGLHATPAGRALSQRAARLLRDVEAAREEQGLIQLGAATLIRVGGLPLTLATLMPEVLARCRGEWPELILQLREATGRQLLMDIYSGAVDCGLGRIPFDESMEAVATDLWLDELSQEDLVAVGIPGHPLCVRRRVQPEELVDYEWILPAARSTSYVTFASALQRVGVAPPRPAVECDASYATILAFVQRFNFLGLLPKTIAQREVVNHRVKILGLPLRMKMPPISFICRRDRVKAPEIARLLAIVRAAVGLAPRASRVAARDLKPV